MQNGETRYDGMLLHLFWIIHDQKDLKRTAKISNLLIRVL